MAKEHIVLASSRSIAFACLFTAVGCSGSSGTSSSSATSVPGGSTKNKQGGAGSHAASRTTNLYHDALATGVRDYSSAAHGLAQSVVAKSGKAIAFDPDRRLALYFAPSVGIDAASVSALTLWVNGGISGGQRIRVALFVDGVVGEGVDLGAYTSGGAIASGRWEQVTIPLADMDAAGKVIEGLWLQDESGGDQAVLYLDDIAFAGSARAVSTRSSPAVPVPAGGQIIVQPTADRWPISPQVYGVSFGERAVADKYHFPVRRWGGNHASRYAWDVDVANRANDWFYMNVPEDNPDPGSLPDGSAADRFIDEALETGGDPIITLPVLGWVPKDRLPHVSFSVQKYGSQESQNGDAGNGIRPDGSAIAADPNDTSRPVGPDYVTDWMAHIAGRVGSAAEGGVRYFALDNEWTLWPETHRDLHPQKVTYDEMWQKTVDYGNAVKAKDPAAQIFAPMAWGWCGYFYTSGECAGGPDHDAHGDFIPWYLDQICSYQKQTGVRLVDYLAVHYYPQAEGVYQGNNRDARLRAPKSLYDANYVDESWIAQPIALIPRMHEWIGEHCPGTKLAITEYSFGGEDDITGALAQAEALAIFGRERLDMGVKWTAPNPGVWLEDGFGIFRNYDGAGATVAGDSVRATSWNADAVSSYAIRDGKKLYVMLFNKQSQGQQVDVTIDGGATGTVSFYGFDEGQRLGARGSAAIDGQSFMAQLPALSATLAVLTLP